MELERAGVPTEDFSIIGREGVEVAGGFEDTVGEAVGGGAAIGATTGGLAGLIAGALATAGVFVAGPILLLVGLGWVALATVAGGAVGAAAGGIVGALVGLGVSEEAAKHHESVIKSGGVLLGADNNVISEQDIRDCFQRYRAEQVVVIEHDMLPARLAARVVG